MEMARATSTRRGADGAINIRYGPDPDAEECIKRKAWRNATLPPRFIVGGERYWIASWNGERSGWLLRMERQWGWMGLTRMSLTGRACWLRASSLRRPWVRPNWIQLALP